VGIPEPEFIVGEYDTKVIFKSMGKSILIPELEKLGLSLNERQKKALQYLTEHKKITNKDYQKLCPEVSRKSVQRDLRELVEINLLKQMGMKRGIYYELNI
jgi:ATP-dependent DNA helicase RecG